MSLSIWMEARRDRHGARSKVSILRGSEAGVDQIPVEANHALDERHGVFASLHFQALDVRLIRCGMSSRRKNASFFRATLFSHFSSPE